MDPSFSNWGYAYALYCPETQILTPKTLRVTKTVKSSVKTLKVNSDDLSRANALSTAVVKAAKIADVIFVEVPHGYESKRSAVGYGMCIGILGALRAQGIPFFEVTAHQVKMATVGSKSASKTAIIDRAVELYPHLDWPTKTYRGVTSLSADSCNHMADAIGAIEAGLLTNEFKQLMAMRQL